MSRALFTEPRITGPKVFLLCTGALCIGMALGFPAGMTLQDALQREAKRIDDAKPKKVQPMANPLTQWSCHPQEFREHADACAKRIVSGRIGNG